MRAQRGSLGLLGCAEGTTVGILAYLDHLGAGDGPRWA